MVTYLKHACRMHCKHLMKVHVSSKFSFLSIQQTLKDLKKIAICTHGELFCHVQMQPKGTIQLRGKVEKDGQRDRLTMKHTVSHHENLVRVQRNQYLP